WVAAGLTEPAMIGGFRLGKRKTLVPSTPGPSVLVASSVPFTVSCSRAVNEGLPPSPPRLFRVPVAARGRSQPIRVRKPPTPQIPVLSQSPPEVSIVPLTTSGPKPSDPASTSISPPALASAALTASSEPLIVVAPLDRRLKVPPPAPPDTSIVPPWVIVW